MNLEEQNSHQDDLVHIKDWLFKQPHLPKTIPDEQLWQFLYSCYWSLETTKKAIDTNYTMKTNTPEFFSNRYLDAPDIKHISKVVQICVLPARTPKGYAVLWGRLLDYDPSKYVLESAIKLLFMVVDAFLRKEPQSAKGFLFVFDNKGTTMGHLTRVNLSSLRKYLHYVQEALPVRLRGVHVVNINPIINQVMTLIKPFIRNGRDKYIFLHNPDHIGGTYDAIPKAMQPKDYGGGGASMDEMASETMKDIRSEEDWFKLDETLKIDASKKPNSTGAMEGSFKKLSID